MATGSTNRLVLANELSEAIQHLARLFEVELGFVDATVPFRRSNSIGFDWTIQQFVFVRLIRKQTKLNFVLFRSEPN